jgi:cold shock protein
MRRRRQFCYADNMVGTGTIIWFDTKAGCGFVKPDDGGPDMFAHLPSNRGQIRRLVPGHRVSYDPGDRVSYELVSYGKPVKTEAVIRAPKRRPDRVP